MQNGKYPIVFKKAGFVELRRTSDEYDNDYLQIRFKDKFALVGSGSFVTGDDWTVSGGVPLDTGTGGDLGQLTNIFLEANDVFKITNNTHWCGWSSNKATGTDQTNFEKTAKKSSDGKVTLTIQVEDQRPDLWTWGKDGYVTKLVTTGSSIPSHNQTIVMDGTYGDVDIYSDCTAVEIMRHKGNDDNNNHSKTLPTDWSKSYYYKIYTYEGGSSVERYDNNTFDNIRVKNTGYYTIALKNTFELLITPLSEFLANDAVYLDLNGQDWVNIWDQGVVVGTAVIAAHFWNSSDPTVSINVQMFEVHGSNWSHILYEAVVPELTSGNPNKVIFYRAETFDASSMNQWNKTGDLSFTMGKNVFKLDSYSDATTTWSDYITNEQRAEYYGTYFNTEVVCTGEGLDPDHHNWSGVKTEYNHMCGNAKAIVKKTVANPSGSQVEKAVSKYDDIVFRKRYAGYDDFMSRNDNDDTSGSHYKGTLSASAEVSPYSLMIRDDLTSTILIIVFSSVALLSLTTLSVLAVRKRNRKEQ